MRAIELRLNNWVWNNVQKIPVKVDVQIIQDQLYADKGLKESWQPIPLTEEILLKCGFEKYEEEKFVIETDIVDYVIEISLDGDYILGVRSLSDIINYFSWDIKSVHQLQNIIFALTSEELKINL